jgi:hypothetical protein
MARRERLSRSTAEETYVRAGELEVFRQLRRDALALDRSGGDGVMALGPFARISTTAVVGELGKTRGAINHVWGSQEAFRAAVMRSVVNDPDLGSSDVVYPDPTDWTDLDGWVGALAATEVQRGPRHRMSPANRYGWRWVAWLGLVPYGIWSEELAAGSLTEYRASVQHYADHVVGPALDRFGRRLVDGTSLRDLAAAVASLIEGVWLNSSLTARDPLDGDRTIEDHLARSIRLLFRGATRPVRDRVSPVPAPGRSARSPSRRR